MVTIPSSQNCVDVKIFDSTTIAHFPLALFAQPQISGKEQITTSYAFYVEYPTLKQRVLFDLGMRKDFKNLPPSLHGMLHFVDRVEKNSIEILQENGVNPETINSIIWSHAHCDHTGDPSLFPASTELVVGPGTKERFLPGYPANPDGRILETDYMNRTLREIDFTVSDTVIGGFPACDFFGDGSFYLLDTPGHEIGHMCALARTTPTTFILMGADSCHHPGTIRPTPTNPLPAEISPNPFEISGPPCTCAPFIDIHPKQSATEPYYTISVKEDGSGLMSEDIAEANNTLDKLKDFDADENVFVALSHDHTLNGVVDLLPMSANNWKVSGWKDLSKWKFLADFEYKK